MKGIIFLVCCLCMVAFTQSDNNTWVQKASYGGGKIHDVASFTIGDFAYVGTGSAQAVLGSYNRTFYRYDGSLDVWKRIADLPSPARARIRAHGLSIGTKGYICGGSIDDPIKWFYSIGDMWEYDPSTNFWYQRANFPRVGGISNGSSFSIGSKGYVGLGKVWQNPSFGEKNDFYEFDPQLNKWTQLQDFPGAPREGAVGFSMNGKGYIGLGNYSESGSYKTIYFKDFWEYDPATDNWTRLPDFPGEGRSNPIGYGINGCCYIGLGGINDFYKYDVNNKTWTILNYLPGAVRHTPLSFYVGSDIYYGGGSGGNSTTYADVWKYSTGSVTSVAKKLETEDFKCFPNPVIDVLEIEMHQNHQITKIKLTDISGKVVVVYENNHNITPHKALNLSSFINGCYTITVEDQNGNLFTKKLLKSK